jgi:hypothetical protein
MKNTHVQIKTADGSRFVIPAINSFMLYEPTNNTISIRANSQFYKFGLIAATDTYVITEDILTHILEQFDELVILTQSDKNYV